MGGLLSSPEEEMVGGKKTPLQREEDELEEAVIAGYLKYWTTPINGVIPTKDDGTPYNEDDVQDYVFDSENKDEIESYKKDLITQDFTKYPLLHENIVKSNPNIQQNNTNPTQAPEKTIEDEEQELDNMAYTEFIKTKPVSRGEFDRLKTDRKVSAFNSTIFGTKMSPADEIDNLKMDIKEKYPEKFPLMYAEKNRAIENAMREWEEEEKKNPKPKSSRSTGLASAAMVAGPSFFGGNRRKKTRRNKQKRNKTINKEKVEKIAKLIAGVLAEQDK
jgi:hypothetical protein